MIQKEYGGFVATAIGFAWSPVRISKRRGGPKRVVDGTFFEMGRSETTTRQALVEENCAYLAQLREVIAGLTDESFVRQEPPYAGGGIGKHTRHICDFYRAFVSSDGDLVDYDKRRRDPRIENNLSSAGAEIGRLAGELPATASWWPKEALRVRYEGAADEAVAESTPARELAFLASHTVHHFAIIAMIARLQGYTVPKNFGIAPSTIHHLQGTGGTTTEQENG